MWAYAYVCVCVVIAAAGGGIACCCCWHWACLPGVPLSAPVELALPPASAQPIHSAPAGRYQERPCRERTQVSRDRGIHRETERERGVWSRVAAFTYTERCVGGLMYGAEIFRFFRCSCVKTANWPYTYCTSTQKNSWGVCQRFQCTTDNNNNNNIMCQASFLALCVFKT